MEKLYYADSHLRQFTARVNGCTPCGRGWQVTLDATAFYPEGGGQACDLGTLGSAQVLDVREQGEQILHLCDAPLAVGAEVTGCIDWQRRFDLMQQHTGEHILSGLIHKKFGFHNTGFHVGADWMEVDFDGPISAQDLAELEYKANEAVWADLPVRTWIPSPEELETVFYRTKRALPWPVRIVQVPGYDSCACCGVHVGRTGEVGLIKILASTRLRGGVRLQMVCGQRAYRQMVTVFEENRLVSQAFSVPMTATGLGAQKMNEALAAEKARAAQLLGQIFDTVAAGYTGQDTAVHFADGLEPGQVRVLADKIAGVIGSWCAVFSGEEGNFAYCLAAREGDLRPMGKEMTAALEGRGGGKPNFQQGSLRATRAEIEAFFIKNALPFGEGSRA